jgi:hypothetical protein
VFFLLKRNASQRRKGSAWLCGFYFYYYYYLFLIANGVLPDGSGNTLRHNKQITYNTQNINTIKRNTAHKTTHTIKYTLHRINTNNYNYNTTHNYELPLEGNVVNTTRKGTYGPTDK